MSRVKSNLWGLALEVGALPDIYCSESPNMGEISCGLSFP